MPMHMDRNTITGFSGRVKKNLQYISKHRAQNADVLVTQLVTSLLGLIVYPYEAFKNTAALQFSMLKLEQLEKKGLAALDIRYHAS